VARSPGAYDGCGFALGPVEELAETVLGLDLDSCLDDAGDPADWALPFLGAMTSYTEISPGGAGLKPIARIRAADLPEVRRLLGIPESDKDQARTRIFGKRVNGAHAPGAQIFLANRYFTITGNHWPTSPEEVRLLSLDDIRKLADLFGPRQTTSPASKTPPVADPDALVGEPALQAKLDVALGDSPKLASRWNGNTVNLGDQSRSGFDMSLGALLIAQGFGYPEMVALLRQHESLGLGPKRGASVADDRYYGRIWANSKATPPPTPSPEWEAAWAPAEEWQSQSAVPDDNLLPPVPFSPTHIWHSGGSDIPVELVDGERHEHEDGRIYVQARTQLPDDGSGKPLTGDNFIPLDELEPIAPTTAQGSSNHEQPTAPEPTGHRPPTPTPPTTPTPTPTPPSGDILVVSDKPWDPAKLPPRPWLAPPYIMRGEIMLLHGLGAAGKSQLIICWSVALALGRKFGRLKPSRRYRVALLGFEDNMIEQMKRISVALRFFHATEAELEGHLFRVKLGPLSAGATMFELDPRGAVKTTDTADALLRICEHYKPDVVALDPFVAINAVPESDNQLMRRVMTMLKLGLAEQFKLGIILVHHDSKAAGDSEEGESLNARGAGDIVNAARMEGAVKRMTKAEAERFGIEEGERGRYFRLGSMESKRSYTEPERAEWFQRKAELLNSEQVVRCEPWLPPTEGVTPQQEADLLAEIAKGTGVGPYSPRLDESIRSLAPILVKLGLQTQAIQRSVMRSLFKSGAIVKASWHDQLRRPRQGIRTQDGEPSGWRWLAHDDPLADDDEG
jgi:hypothetical protein